MAFQREGSVSPTNDITHIIVVPQDDIARFAVAILHPQLRHGRAERHELRGDRAIRRSQRRDIKRLPSPRSASSSKPHKPQQAEEQLTQSGARSSAPAAKHACTMTQAGRRNLTIVVAPGMSTRDLTAASVGSSDERENGRPPLPSPSLYCTPGAPLAVTHPLRRRGSSLPSASSALTGRNVAETRGVGLLLW